MRIEVLGAILAMIAPFIFHYLLQTKLKMRYIVLIMACIIMLCVVTIIDLSTVAKYLSSLPRIWLIRFAAFAVILIFGVWQYFYIRRKRGRR